MVARDSSLPHDRVPVSHSAPSAAAALDWLRQRLTVNDSANDSASGAVGAGNSAAGGLPSPSAAAIAAALAHAHGTVSILLESYDDEASIQAAALAAAAQWVAGDLIEQRFGLAVRRLVDSVSQISRLRELFRSPNSAGDAADLETLRRMTLALASDIRVVLIRLASRLQTLRTHANNKTQPDLAVARETLDVLAPLANRLGIWQMKWELEDLAFRFLQPAQYKQLAAQLEERRVEREGFLRSACDELTSLLAQSGIVAQVSWRPKHIYSIQSKMLAKSISLSEVLDLRAMRVIVDDVKDCYAALAIVHQRWQAIGAEFDDYIARPKPNGYQSLHTVVAADDDRALEIQLRTAAMHRAAEYGLAAHWVYKERGQGLNGAAQARAGEMQQLAWLRELLAWQHDVGARLSATSLTNASANASTNASANALTNPSANAEPADPLAATLTGAQARLVVRIFVITPQGRVVELPQDATPIDFAYHVHTDLGHRCRGARVDGQMVPLHTRLRNAQVVEIITTRRGQESSGPSRDWLNPSLGYLRSNRARAKVRQWFNAQEQAQSIAAGRERVERQMQREGKTALSFDALSARLGYVDTDAMFLAAAREELGPRAIELALRDAGTAVSGPQPEVAKPPAAVAERSMRPVADASAGKGAVLIVGVDALLTQLARCCRPLPPDAISGFVTRGRGISVHRRDCSAFARLREVAGERVVAASWGGQTAREPARNYVAELVLKTLDRPHLQRDLLDVCARARITVAAVTVLGSRADQLLQMAVQVSGLRDLASLIASLAAIRGVVSVRRKIN